MATIDVAIKHPEKGWMCVGGGSNVEEAREAARRVMKRRRGRQEPLYLLAEQTGKERRIVEVVQPSRWWELWK